MRPCGTKRQAQPALLRTHAFAELTGYGRDEGAAQVADLLERGLGPEPQHLHHLAQPAAFVELQVGTLPTKPVEAALEVEAAPEAEAAPEVEPAPETATEDEAAPAEVSEPAKAKAAKKTTAKDEAETTEEPAAEEAEKTEEAPAKAAKESAD